jgi:hypothetical protein
MIDLKEDIAELFAEHEQEADYLVERHTYFVERDDAARFLAASPLERGVIRQQYARDLEARRRAAIVAPRIPPAPRDDRAKARICEARYRAANKEKLAAKARERRAVA